MGFSLRALHFDVAAAHRKIEYYVRLVFALTSEEILRPGGLPGWRSTCFGASEVIMSKRELIEPKKGDKRYVRRDAEGQFTTSQDNVSRSLSADRRTKAKTIVPKGQGDRGDQKRKLAN